MATETRKSQNAVEVVDVAADITTRESTQTEEAVRGGPDPELVVSQQAEEVVRGIFSEMVESQHVLEVVGFDLFALPNVKESQFAIEVIMIPEPPAPAGAVLNVFVTT